jgi:uncharacterized phage-associated protein
MTHSALQVASKMIELGLKKNPVQKYTPMQLLKLVYISHGWMLALFNRPLFNEKVEAWKYGPVIPELYESVKHYKARPVEELKAPVDGTFDSDELGVLQYVINAYGHIDGITLSQITHAPNTPWSMAYDHVYWGNEISNNLITNHYKNLLEDLKNKAKQKQAESEEDNASKC